MPRTGTLPTLRDLALSRSSCVSVASDADCVRPTCPSPVPLSPSGAHLAAPTTTQQEESHSISRPPQLARHCPVSQGPGRAENTRTLMFPRGRRAQLGPWLAPGRWSQDWGGEEAAVPGPWNGPAWVAGRSSHTPCEYACVREHASVCECASAHCECADGCARACAC